jgi:hypothetical protein
MMNTDNLQMLEDTELESAAGGGWAYDAGAAAKYYVCAAGDWAYNAMFSLALANPPSY